MPLLADRYVTVLLTDIACFALFAVSLHFIMGPAGMVSFGHAAYFGLGAYAGALLFKKAGLPMELALVLAPFVAGLFAVVYGWFCVRLSGVYLAMLTLAFAQISLVDRLPVGRAHLGQQRPGRHLARRLARRQDGLLLPDPRAVRRSASPCCGARCSRRSATCCAPAAIRRCAPRRSASTCAPIQWAAFVLAGTFAGLAGAVFAFSKGSISPSSISIAQSTDGLVMVLLGGVDTLVGPVVGAAVFTWLRDTLARETEFWRAVLGLVILLIVVVFPQGLVGGLKSARRALAAGMSERCCRSTGCTRRSAACRRSRTSPSPSRPASCWR